MEDKIKLSDYLNYLYNEVVEARKNADRMSILIAKEYAKDEYLKYFKAPRFTMPSISLEIPIKIAELDTDLKYEIKIDEEDLIKDINSRINLSNKSKNLNLKLVDVSLLKNKNYLKTLDIVNQSVKFNNKETVLGKFGIGSKISRNVILNEPKADSSKLDAVLGNDHLKDFIKKSDEETNDANELNNIIFESLLDRNRLVSAKLNNIFIDPNTTSTSDKGKILLKMNVEMVDEGIRINSVKDKNGNDIEEIIID